MIATKISNCSSFMYYKTEPQPILGKDTTKTENEGRMMKNL